MESTDYQGLWLRDKLISKGKQGEKIKEEI